MRRLARTQMQAPSAPPGTDRCPRCDAAFACAIASGRCWCAEIELSAERQAELAVTYDGCLCPTCLRELAQIA